MKINGIDVVSVYCYRSAHNLLLEQHQELPEEDFIDFYIPATVIHTSYRPHHYYYDVAGMDDVPTGFLIPDQKVDVLNSAGESIGVLEVPKANHTYRLWPDSAPQDVYKYTK